MKKILYFCCALLAVALTTTSCDDNEDDVIVFENTPEVDAAGTYVGTFSRVQVGAANPDTTYAEGTIVLAESSPYVAWAQFKCEPFTINTECHLNIAHSDQGFAMSNNLSTNTLGAPLFGRIDNDGNTEIHMQLAIRSGRGTKTYNITFVGRRE